MNTARPAIAARTVTLSFGEVMALALRSGQGVHLFRGLEVSVAAWRAEAARTACPTSDLQTALNYFRVQASLTASEDFYRFLERLGASLEDVLDVFRAGYYGGLPDLPASFSRHPDDLASVCHLLPMAAIVEGHWGAFTRQASLMLAAFESRAGEGLGGAGLPEGLGGEVLQRAAAQLGVTPERLDLLGRICNCFQQSCARASTSPEFDSELSIMATDLTQVATLEAHATSEGVARELFACVKHDGRMLLELCGETGISHESCLHRVAGLRSRRGWEPLAFAHPGEVFYMGSWDGSYVVAHVQQRILPDREDSRLQRRVAETILTKNLGRERELIQVLIG